MANIRDTLDCACLVAQCLNQEGASVLVHDTSGQDATLIVSALAQIILNPDCRTVRGFEALLEREWVQAGHPFCSRHSRSCYSPPTHRHRHNCPTFLLFLDAVHQIHAQFACSFEFNEDFLIMLFEHSYSSQFGTFMGDCEQDKSALKIKKFTTSLWSHINSPDVLPQYLSSVYQPNPSVIWPSVAPVSLVSYIVLHKKVHFTLCCIIFKWNLFVISYLFYNFIIAKFCLIDAFLYIQLLIAKKVSYPLLYLEEYNFIQYWKKIRKWYS